MIDSVVVVFRGVIFLLLLMPSIAAAGESPPNMPVPVPPVREKVVMGWLESIFIKPWNVRVTAKLDTGAKTSSLHAANLVRFSRDGQDWIRFTLKGSDADESVTVERPLVRTAYIKERMTQASKRDVVKLLVCKNGKEYETEFTLVDRSHFNYPLLLGRNFLQDAALVDSSGTFLFKAETDPCKSASPAIPPQGKGK